MKCWEDANGGWEDANGEREMRTANGEQRTGRAGWISSNDGQAIIGDDAKILEGQRLLRGKD